VYRTQILEEIGRVQDKHPRRQRHSTRDRKRPSCCPGRSAKQIAVAEGTLKNTKDDVAAWQRRSPT
jgi:hypothetical protein